MCEIVVDLSVCLKWVVKMTCDDVTCTLYVRNILIEIIHTINWCIVVCLCIRELAEAAAARRRVINVVNRCFKHILIRIYVCPWNHNWGYKPPNVINFVKIQLHWKTFQKNTFYKTLYLITTSSLNNNPHPHPPTRIIHKKQKFLYKIIFESSWKIVIMVGSKSE